MNKCNTFSSFPPVATKTLRSISSVVHHHALGHNISSSGHHTIHFIRESYLWNKEVGMKDLCGIVQREAELFAL